TALLRSTSVVQRLAICEQLSLLENPQFLSGHLRHRENALLDSLARDLIVGVDPWLASASGGNEMTAFAHRLPMENMLRFLCGADVNEQVMSIKLKKYGTRTLSTVQLSDNPQEWNIALWKRVQGMVRKPQAWLYNPDWVGDSTLDKMVRLDGIFYKPGSTTRIDGIVVEAKFIESLLKSGGRRARDSIWDSVRSWVYSTGTTPEVWLAVTKDMTTAEIVQYVTDQMKYDGRTTPNQGRYIVGTGAHRSAEGTTFDIGMRLPGKVDAYKIEKLQGYIDAYVASHPASTPVDTMMQEIVQSHPELGIDATSARAFLVKNRDPANDYRTVVKGTDPSEVNPYATIKWSNPDPSSPFDVEVYKTGTGITIGQIASDCKDPATGMFDARQIEVFFVDTRPVVLRVVRVDATRQDVIMSNMALLDVWCHLGWTDNPLWNKAGTWWAPYLIRNRHRKVVP
nr:hypothetical protein [Candidatus Sigynarchaeota archaeon]